MAARSSDSADRRGSRAHEAGRPAAHAVTRHSLRPRLAAIAPSTAEVVRFAGGWLFDYVMAGWEAMVLTADHGDRRPLEILGARARDPETVLALLAGRCLQAIAVRADLYESDALVRRMVRTAVEEGPAEVRFWGDFRRHDIGNAAAPVAHRLSLAARAFKAQALAAAVAAAGPREDVEVFRRGAGVFSRDQVLGPDLGPLREVPALTRAPLCSSAMSGQAGTRYHGAADQRGRHQVRGWPGERLGPGNS